jgi:hypothetical protein
MAITIELSPDEEARLAALAKQSGIAAAQMARKLVVEHLPPTLDAAERARRETVMSELVSESQRLGLY